MIRVPVLCTREDVINALDFAASFRVSQVDRAVISAADNVHKLCNRKFYPQDSTRYFDWPNYQFTYPWKIYLDENELAAPATQILTGTNQPAPTVIPITAVNFEPVNYGPPYSWIELRRDLSSTFGANSTPQRDTSVQGTFGFWTQTDPAGAFAANISSSVTVITVTDGSTGTGICVGDILLAGSERMLAADKQPVATSDVLTGAGCTTLSFTDNQLAVASGAAYAPGEQLLIDQEQMLVLYIIGNTLTVRRAWAASALATHIDGAAIYAFRQCTVVRGALGTTAAAHSSGDTLAKYEIPGSVRELAVAEAEAIVMQGTAGWQRKTATLDTMYEQSTEGRAVRGKDTALDGLNDLRQRVRRDYGRKMRQRTG